MVCSFVNQPKAWLDVLCVTQEKNLTKRVLSLLPEKIFGLEIGVYEHLIERQIGPNC